MELNLNQIDGIIIPFNKIQELVPKDIQDLLEIFQKNNSLKLFIYDLNLEQNILREIGNTEAIELLKTNNGLDNINVHLLSPFVGKNSPFAGKAHDNVNATEIFISKKNAPLEVFLQAQQLDMLKNLCEATSSKQRQNIFNELNKIAKDKNIICQEMLREPKIYSKVLATILQGYIEERESQNDETGYYYYKYFLNKQALVTQLAKNKGLLKLLIQLDYKGFTNKLNEMLQQHETIYQPVTNNELTTQQIVQEIIRELGVTVNHRKKNNPKI
jgi:hypothetical protein